MVKKTKPKFQRSDIPLKDRLLMNKFSTVAEHRDHAALTAMKIATVALNDTEGMGYCGWHGSQNTSRLLQRSIILTRSTWRRNSTSGLSSLGLRW